LYSPKVVVWLETSHVHIYNAFQISCPYYATSLFTTTLLWTKFPLRSALKYAGTPALIQVTLAVPCRLYRNSFTMHLNRSNCKVFLYRDKFK
jgi:hypothetical protein